MTDPIRKHCAKILQLWDADCDLDSAMEHLRRLIAKPEPAGEVSDGPPVPISAHDLAIQWNQQADPSEQWDTLEPYEQLAWAQTRAIALDRSRAPVQPADGEVAELAQWLRKHYEYALELGRPDWAEKSARSADLLQQGQSALHRLHRLQQENARFREPERTLLCDLLANGTLLPDPDGKRYGGQPVDGEVADEELDRLERRHCDLSIYTHFMDWRAVPYPGVTYVG
jgi:hypothetical protein